MSTEPASVVSLDELRAALKRSLRRIAALETELGAANRREHEPIAIVGMGCRMPGGINTPEEFWRLLVEARAAIREIPADRPQLLAVSRERPAFRWGGFLDQVDRFDPQFFGISPREALWMDPQQRLLLEVCWQALEHAGKPPEALAGTQTGVFVGMVSSEGYLEATRATSRTNPDAYAATGSTLSVAAGRIAYTLGLHGPALVVDTACSSSLVALELAARSLREGECDLALAGGVSLMLSGHDARVLTMGNALAPDGRCRAFDAQANGLVRAEGCGVVVLARLSDAIARGDRVLGLVRGAAINQDGRSAGLTAPNAWAQEDVLRRALARAGIAAADIDFVETHGTGTALGDPIELEALSRVYAANGGSESACVLGAVKSNLGHLEAAAGMAGLIKTVLALQHEQIPSNLHFHTLHPSTSLAGTRLRIANEALAWPRRAERARYAGVSSFGMSGTNAHVILQEAPAAQANAATAQANVSTLALPHAPSARHVLLVSARDAEVLRTQAEQYARYLERADASLTDICYSAALRRTHHEQRLAVLGADRAELLDGLRAYVKDEARPSLVSGRVTGFERPKLVFVFPGQGSQWLGMGRQLYATEPVFRDAVDACAAACAPHCDWSLTDALLHAADGGVFERVRTLQPLLFTLEVALSTLWQHWGIVPDAVVGASMGEVAAAHCAGILSLETAARITCQRSALLSPLEERGGAMALTELSFEQAEHWIAQFAGRVVVASSNSPRSTVLTGDRAALAQLLTQLEAKQLFCRWVNAKGAGHSPVIDEVLPAYARALETFPVGAERFPIYSSVEGQRLPAAAFAAPYWLRNVRQTVHFSRACESLIKTGHRLFLEVSPHPILLPAIHQVAAKLDRPCSVLGSLYRQRDECLALQTALAGLHCHGYAIDWARHGDTGQLVDLPPYPFRRDAFWMPPLAAAEAQHELLVGPASQSDHPLLGRIVSVAHPETTRYWQSTLDLQRLGYLADHCIERTVVLPAAAIIEMACAAGRALLSSAALVIEDLVLNEALVLDEQSSVTLQVVMEALDAQHYAFRLARRIDEPAANPAWRVHATGRVRAATAQEQSEASPGASAASTADTRGDSTLVYERLAAMGGKYGPAFRGLREVWSGKAAARAEVKLADTLDASGYLAHPALLDACLQTLAVAELPDELQRQEPCVPVSFERIVLHAALPAAVAASARIDLAVSTRASLSGALVVRDPASARVLLTIDGVRVQPLMPIESASPTDELTLKTSWRNAPPAVTPAVATLGTGHWLILCDGAGLGTALAQQLTAAGASVACVLPERDDFHSAAFAKRIAAILEGALTTGTPLRGIVHLWGVDDVPFEAHSPLTASAGWITALGERGWSTALQLVQALGARHFRDAPRLVLVTRHAQPVLDGDPIAPEQALLWGLGGTIHSESSAWQTRRVDLAHAALSEQLAGLLHELASDDDEDQVAWRGAQRFVARLQRAPVQRAAAARVQPTFVARADATYLVTGGMSGLGLSAARWLAGQGAGHLLLLGRHLVESAQARADFRALEQLGSRVSLIACDVSDPRRLAQVLLEHVPAEQPLRGIIHAAGTLQDGLLARQSSASFETVLRPKLAGAWLLHALTRRQPLDLFVLYSSAASVMGSAGQANYVAANAFLDALAHHRRTLGLTALSINWGQFAEIGAVADRQFHGLRGLTEREGHALLESLIARAAPQFAAVALNVSELLDFYPHMARWPFLSELMSEQRATSQGDAELLAQLTAGDAEQRTVSMRVFLRTELARVLRMDPARIDDEAPLGRLGLDSLMGLELRRRLEAALGLSLPATLIWTYPTLLAVADHLTEALTSTAISSDAALQPSAASAVLSSTTEQDGAEELAALSDQQLWSLTNALVN